MRTLTLLIVAAGCAEAAIVATSRAIDSGASSTAVLRGAGSGSPNSASIVVPTSHIKFSQDTLSNQRPWDLRLCNAYAYDGWVHVYHGSGRRSATSYTESSGDGETRLTTRSGPLPFKRCTDVSGVPLQLGSVLNFRIAGDMTIGTFLVQDLPEHGSMLQLVLKRRDTWSTAADFSSHVFSATATPQVAIVNAYLGPARSVLEVRGVPTGFERLSEPPSEREEVHWGTVVDIAPGRYEWHLMSTTRTRHHAEKAYVEFKAAGQTPYTIIRVGTEAVGGQSYSEELVVWPAEGAELHNGFADPGAAEKGLFGLPTDLSSRRSRAFLKLPSVMAL
jgi:hypothetical protein